MKFTRVFAFMALAGMAGSAFATNGDNLIGLGAQSRALGGTGTAAFFGSENALTNPALLGKMQGTEFAIGGTVFMPDVKATSNVATPPGTSASATSDADLSVIPEVSLATRINDNLTFGLGMYGTAGMGVDYRGEDPLNNGGLFQAYTNLQLMKFVPSLAYNNGAFGVGAAAVIQYGALDMNYVTPGGTVGDGTATDLGFGFNLGGYYDVTKDLTVGLAYQSEIGMNYDHQLTIAADGFGVGPNGMGVITSNDLAQPAEIKAGVAYTMGPWMFTGDYKRIMWSDADGYKDFNWDDQDVFGLGVKYSANGWWVGVGFNHGDDPIQVLPNASGMTGYANQAINMFNNHFFPAVVEDHLTVGGGVSLGKNTMLEGALVYADETSKTIDTGSISGLLGAGNPDAFPANATTHTVDHSQLGITVSVRMNF
ncbi:MAG: outer membrane protein transport protein [Thiobacillus sp.]|jgi:long-chain fatty acid transport protein|uniref:OmpP1/FadL family transporter n=1 Tax=Thiobacillus sp. TaxID=924 RepID=UPI002895564E|nr:outer membrane protein transport protein [Thiobacillus sp.]MDT3708008.1 outer membrane protein transport protein [Thiobacillus sp.]